MELPPTLHNKIIEFFLSLPNIQDTKMRRALLERAGLDSRLHDQIDVSGPPAELFPTLVTTLVRYGTLEDERQPLEALLETAKLYVGGQKGIYCDELIEEFRSVRSNRFSGQETAETAPTRRWIFSRPAAGQRVRYFIEIERKNGRYRGRIHQGNPQKCCTLPDLKLGPDDQVTLKGRPVVLKDLIRSQTHLATQHAQFWADEVGQYELGVYLYRQLFGRLRPAEIQPKTGEVDLRIITEDEHIAGLPWMLLAQQGVFLVKTAWSVTLAHRVALIDCEPPSAPKMLIIAPQPESTDANTHLNALEELLSAADPDFIRGNNLQVVTGWEMCRAALSAFEPEFVYVYGAGSEAAADLLSCLREMPPNAPLLVYLNCCGGTAEGFLRAGTLMAHLIPAVAISRTVGDVSAAQAQGLVFWENVLLQGRPPHQALAHLRSRSQVSELSVCEQRWLTPALYCHYDRWESQPLRPPGRLERDPHWRVKLDRVRQFSRVFFETYQMLMERKPRALGYLWYGGKEQGLELFHKRLNVELQEKLIKAILYEVRPDWPMDLADPHQSFHDMLAQAFGIRNLEQLGACIRKYSRSVSGRQTLVYIRHTPVTSKHTFHPENLKTYLEWFNIHFVPKLPEQSYALLGISYEVQNPSKFYDLLTRKERLNELELPDNMVFQLLDELERVHKQDLLDFLKTHRIQLPADVRDEMLEDILKKTKGVYEKVLDKMKDLERHAWRLRKKAE
ncbi:MAG: hypothetical protein GY952_03995, partial [Rhodobacteraceae bacterium]|nr:hypothetical protein [Paracoccaceae bacterium]